MNHDAINFGIKLAQGFTAGANTAHGHPPDVPGKPTPSRTIEEGLTHIRRQNQATQPGNPVLTSKTAEGAGMAHPYPGPDFSGPVHVAQSGSRRFLGDVKKMLAGQGGEDEKYTVKRGVEYPHPVKGTTTPYKQTQKLPVVGKRLLTSSEPTKQQTLPERGAMDIGEMSKGALFGAKMAQDYDMPEGWENMPWYQPDPEAVFQSAVQGVGIGGIGLPAALGAAGGGLYGALAPGEDEEGKPRSRLMEALKRALIGGGLGAGAGVASLGGALGGGALGVMKHMPHTDMKFASHFGAKMAGVFYRDIEPVGVGVSFATDKDPDPTETHLLSERTKAPRSLTRMVSNPTKDYTWAAKQTQSLMQSPDMSEYAQDPAVKAMMYNQLLQQRWPSRYRPISVDTIMQVLEDNMPEEEEEMSLEEARAANAGCEWNSETGQMECRSPADDKPKPKAKPKAKAASFGAKMAAGMAQVSPSTFHSQNATPAGSLTGGADEHNRVGASGSTNSYSMQSEAPTVGPASGTRAQSVVPTPSTAEARPRGIDPPHAAAMADQGIAYGEVA